MHAELTTAYKQGAVSYHAVTHWFDQFSSARKSLEDYPRNDRRITVVTQQNIVDATDLVKDDPQIGID
ncbi:unnamed protein product [Rotaria sp. Silwood2]|nr:unnamed protein product [Rotaria sp. Silwood2]CAF3092763.1 unnamed protein product [Rotaria sp. Silwood2]CAF3943579.1 unnamed protein product [Rotaria sp. Silwood2]CAF4162418.1 unnamed protein product [Rotaria sp. Silwood2]CAF4250001.1 unnamed protein product [Rotaria sp. Silwood2]